MASRHRSSVACTRGSVLSAFGDSAFEAERLHSLEDVGQISQSVARPQQASAAYDLRKLLSSLREQFACEICTVKVEQIGWPSRSSYPWCHFNKARQCSLGV